MTPICFMVMPFGTKDVTSTKAAAPKKVNFDRLWDVALMPAIQKLGFLPVRADAEADAVIVQGMLNRLKHADLVLADVSIPNGNVYYEVGVRHVAKTNRCVLIAADWFEPLFDIRAMRIVTYPLSATDVEADQAAKIVERLSADVEKLRDVQTPYYALVEDDFEKAFVREAEQLSAFQVDVATVRLLPNGTARSSKIQELVREHSAAAKVVPEVALELICLIRDVQDWKAACDFIESLPQPMRAVETIQEQYQLALSESGRIPESIAGLKELIRRFGPTPERCGLLGGRYKRLYRQARAAREGAENLEPSLDERNHLNAAIESYEQGFLLDLNEYYCSGNLPSLLRTRGKRGDAERADAIDTMVIAACKRAEERKSQDPWLPDTLFGTAFRRGDVAALEEIVDKVERGVPWRLGSTLTDAREWIAQAPAASRDELSRILDRLRRAHDEKQKG